MSSRISPSQSGTAVSHWREIDALLRLSPQGGWNSWSSLSKDKRSFYHWYSAYTTRRTDVRQCAAKVRKLILAGPPDVFFEQVAQLEYWLGTVPFPNLKELTISEGCALSTQHVAHLRTHLRIPGLQVLYLYEATRDLCELVRSLNRLNWLLVKSRSGLQCDFAFLPESAPQLTWLSLSIPYNAAILDAISKSPKLSHLELYGGFADSIPEVPRIARGFQSLSSLTISGTSTVRLACAIVAAVGGEKRLTAIVLHQPYPSQSPDGFAAIVDALVQNSQCAALKSFRFNQESGLSAARFSASNRNFPDSLESFPCLTEVVLVSWRRLLITDRHCMAMPAWWAGLRVLKLYNLWEPSEDTVHLSLLPLVTFAEECAALEELGLVFDARSAVPLVPESLSPSRSRLRLFDVYQSPIHASNQRDVAQFLRTLFPHLHKGDPQPVSQPPALPTTTEPSGMLYAEESPYGSMWASIGAALDSSHSNGSSVDDFDGFYVPEPPSGDAILVKEEPLEEGMAHMDLDGTSLSTMHSSLREGMCSDAEKDTGDDDWQPPEGGDPVLRDRIAMMEIQMRRLEKRNRRLEMECEALERKVEIMPAAAPQEPEPDSDDEMTPTVYWEYTATPSPSASNESEAFTDL